MLKVPCFVLRMQFAYLENYFSASDCQAKRLGMGTVQGVKRPFFLLALNQSLAKLPGCPGTHCIFQSGLTYVILLSPFCLNTIYHQ